MSVRKGKQIYVNDKERLTLQTMISLEIQSNENHGKYNKLGMPEIEPIWKTDDLKKLYKKVAGREYIEER